MYNTQTLPLLVTGTAGIAKPKPGVEVAVVRVPESTNIMTPWGQNLYAPTGTAHIAQDGIGDSYPNLEFDAFYVEGDVVTNPGSDPRAKYLDEFWTQRGYPGLTIRTATKTKNAICLGRVDKSAWGKAFEL